QALSSCFVFSTVPRPPISTLFPYTTLFRSTSGSVRGGHSVRSARPAGILHGQYRQQLFSGTRRQGSKGFEGSDRIESPDKTSPGRSRPAAARTIARTGQVLFKYRLPPRYGRQSETGGPQAAGQRQAAGTRTFEDPPGGITADRERFHEHPAETVVSIPSSTR